MAAGRSSGGDESGCGAPTEKTRAKNAGRLCHPLPRPIDSRPRKAPGVRRPGPGCLSFRVAATACRSAPCGPRRHWGPSPSTLLRVAKCGCQAVGSAGRGWCWGSGGATRVPRRRHRAPSSLSLEICNMHACWHLAQNTSLRRPLVAHGRCLLLPRSTLP